VSAATVAGISPARAWILATRPATLPAAAVPVIVGAAAAVSDGASFRPWVFVATLICALLIQIGTNFANDYSDFQRGADNEGRLGPLRVTQSELISQAAVQRGIVVAFGLALIVGASLVWIGGLPILLIGILSVISGLAYTGGPFPFGYHGLGDLFVFIFFGLIAVTGTAYLQSGAWTLFPFLLSIPIGLIVTNVLVINNLRDRPTDIAAGKRTLATRLGDRATRAQYVTFLIIAYLVPVVIAVTDRKRLPLLATLLSLPLALSLARRVMNGTSGRELNPMLKQTGQLLLLFGVLLSAGALIGRSI
jgi:1,4-dihydroxy-2-naphthoate polyprenyltransferase